MPSLCETSKEWNIKKLVVTQWRVHLVSRLTVIPSLDRLNILILYLWTYYLKMVEAYPLTTVRNSFVCLFFIHVNITCVSLLQNSNLTVPCPLHYM